MNLLCFLIKRIVDKSFCLFKNMFVSNSFRISCILPYRIFNFSSSSFHSLPKNYFSLEGFCFLDEYFEIENFFNNVTVITEKSLDFPYSEFPWEDDITNIHEDLYNYFYKSFLFDYHLTISDEEVEPFKDFSFIYIVFYKTKPKLVECEILNKESSFNQNV